MIYILVLALIRPGTAPPVPFLGRYDWRFVRRVLVALVPPLTLILLVLGSIIMGIATVNQAGAIGAVGALIMAGYRLKDRARRARSRPELLAIASLTRDRPAFSISSTSTSRTSRPGRTEAFAVALAGDRDGGFPGRRCCGARGAPTRSTTRSAG